MGGQGKGKEGREGRLTADIHQVNAHDEKHLNRMVKRRKDYIILAHYMYKNKIK